MKKQYMLLIMAVIGIMTARAQSSSTTIQFDHQIQSALVLELPNTADEAEGTILFKLKERGYDPETQGHLFWKKDKIDGFYVFNGVTLSSVSAMKLDVYFKIIQKNNEEKSKSTLYMLISKGNNNFISPTADTALWNASELFLNSFREKTIAFSLEQDITAQENTVNDARNKLTTLQKDEKDLADKIKKYQEEMTANQSNQVNQLQNIENQIKLLADLKLKRK